MKGIARSALRTLAGLPAIAPGLLKLAGKRGRGLVLLYHDVGEEANRAAVVQAISQHRLARHIEVLRELGDIVPLAEMLDRRGDGQPRFAITFDDDSASYARLALPVLTAARVRATFFLSGRSIHGMRAYWWDILDWWIANHGLERTIEILGAPSLNARSLAAWCEGREVIDRLYEAAPAEAAMDRLLGVEGIREIVARGMDVGFHTLRHPVLPELADEPLAAAMVEGRAALQAVVGSPLAFLSYPHGRTDDRVARAAAAAGYRAAFGSRGHPYRSGLDSMRLDRWEPGDLSVDALRGEIAWRLNRAV